MASTLQLGYRIILQFSLPSLIKIQQQSNISRMPLMLCEVFLVFLDIIAFHIVIITNEPEKTRISKMNTTLIPK